MDVLSDRNDSAWYQPGPRPEEKGNAVIDGHVDTPAGSPFIFANLIELLPGDIITILDENGKEVHFSVTNVETYGISDVPLDSIFIM